MYCYITEPIDCFEGMIPLHKIEAWTQDTCQDERESALADMFKLAMSCAYKMALSGYVGWEGDIRDQELYVFALPDPDNSGTLKGLIWKQDNNGTTLTCSPVELPWMKMHEVKCKA